MKRFKKVKDIKVGVIGYGGMAPNHMFQMKDTGMTPVAVCDVDKERLEAAQKSFPGIEAFTSVPAMLKKSDVNLLAIVTPHCMHAKQAVQCLNAGRHVVTEKPFAVTTAECDAMIAAAKKNRCLLSTYHNRHWDGWILDAMQKIKAGVIGDVIRVEAHMGGYSMPGTTWRSSKSMSGGILYDWGVHLLEYSLQIIDSDIVAVMGMSRTGFWGPKTSWKADTNEDEALAIVRFKSGQWLQLSISSIDSLPKTDRGMLEITGTKGTYVMDGGRHKILTHEGSEVITTSGGSRESEGWRFYQNIADHLTKGTKLVITPEWARRPIHILDLADRSAKQGVALKAKYK